MSKPELTETDVVVLGSGPVGENVAERVVQGGLTCTIVEKELVGGECSYWACMPSKALLRPGAAFRAAKRVQGAAAAVTGELNVQEVLARRDSFTSGWDDSGQVKWLESAGVSLVRGAGSIVGPKRVRVSVDGEPDIQLRAKHAVVIATGSEPSIPPIDGLEDVPFWRTREATSAKDVPERLTVVGGGVAALELAQAFASLGSDVVVLARSGLLSGFPDEAAELVENALASYGIDVRKNIQPARVSRLENGGIHVELEGGGFVDSDVLLISTGRHPSTEGIGLEDLGLDPKKLGIADTGLVDGADGDWLYAVGDAAGKVLLTHQGKYEARATGDYIAAVASGKLTGAPERWSRFRSMANAVAVPQVVFTDPELAQVGMSSGDARQQLPNVLTVPLPISVAGSSLLADGYEGWSEFVIDMDRRVLVGATFAGQDVAELLHAATIAIVGEVPLNRLWHCVPSYPTVSELWLRQLEALEKAWRENGGTSDPFAPPS